MPDTATTFTLFIPKSVGQNRPWIRRIVERNPAGSEFVYASKFIPKQRSHRLPLGHEGHVFDIEHSGVYQVYDGVREKFYCSVDLARQKLCEIDYQDIDDALFTDGIMSDFVGTRRHAWVALAKKFPFPGPDDKPNRYNWAEIESSDEVLTDTVEEVIIDLDEL